MKNRYYVYVPELHFRKVKVKAKSEQDAIFKVKEKFGEVMGTYKMRELKEYEGDWLVDNA